MKNPLPIALSLGLTAFSLTGCSKESDPSAVQAPPAEQNPAASAVATDAAVTPKAPRIVEVQATDSMKFTVTRIEAKPGEQLQLKLVNAGTLPKQAMGHNLVLLQKGANVQTFANAALTAQATEYIPASLKSQVIAHTKLLGPKESDTVTITVPSEPGDYPYLCSFPAHAAAGMKGTLVVSER